MGEKMIPTDDSFNTSPLSAHLKHSWERLNAGDAEQAAQLFHAAIAMTESEFGAVNLETARVFVDIGAGLFSCGERNYDEAIQLLDRALRIQVSVEGECDIGCARLHRQLASMQMSRKNYEGAVVSYRKAIDIFLAVSVFGPAVDSKEKDSLYKDLKTALLRADELSEEPDGEESAMSRLHHCVEGD